MRAGHAGLGRRVLQESGTASAKALRLKVLGLFKEQQRGQCGWSRVNEREGRRRLGETEWG